MKRVTVFLLAFAFVGMIGAESASATPITLDEAKLSLSAPTATVDGQTLPFEITPIYEENGDDAKGAGAVIGYQVLKQELIFKEGDIVTTEGYALFDPIITAAIGVVDFGAASNFAVAVASPLVPPITTAAVGSLSLSGSFADGAADGGSATPFLTPQIAQATIEGGGVADAGPAAVFATPTDTYAPITVPYNFDCSALGDGQCDSFDLLISFTGSGGSDAISFTARHEINPIPEPASLVLLGLGLLGTAFVVRKRHRS